LCIPVPIVLVNSVTAQERLVKLNCGVLLDFLPAVLAEVACLPLCPTRKIWPVREDLRHLPLVPIDDADANDLAAAGGSSGEWGLAAHGGHFRRQPLYVRGTALVEVFFYRDVRAWTAPFVASFTYDRVKAALLDDEAALRELDELPHGLEVITMFRAAFALYAAGHVRKISRRERHAAAGGRRKKTRWGKN
jgi:hypothetical protein